MWTPRPRTARSASARFRSKQPNALSAALRCDFQRIKEALERAVDARSPALEVIVGGLANTGSVGLVPGSFDPPTIAHLALAEGLRDLGISSVLLVYSARTLPKASETVPALLDDAARVETALALTEGRDWLGVAVASHGLLAEQAEAAAATFPGSAITIAIGSDKLSQILDPSWYEDSDRSLDTLFGIARVAYAMRTGSPAQVKNRWRDRLIRLDLPSEIAGVSSSEVRRQLLEGRTPSGVPPEVLAFLRS